ncbi:MAG: ATP-dependent DNA helicase RecG [Bacteroidaceae bacterium]|nr:ATP-dependent DNA helicase RecG [Bacteroidaceae bacterium]
MSTTFLDKELTYLPGIGPKRAELLQKELGLKTWEDLLYYFPYKHIDRSRLYRTSELTSDMPFVQLKGRFISFEQMGEGRKQRLIGHFTDGYGWVDCVWFNSQQYILKTIKLHTDYILFGRPSLFNERINLNHPDVDAADTLMLSKMSMQPYYQTTERMKKAGLNSRTLEKFTSTLLRQIPIGAIAETLPRNILDRLCMVSLDEALRAAHYPSTSNELTQANYRLKFEELFYVQLSVLRYARFRQGTIRGHVFSRVGENFNYFYSNNLPFQLTEAQKRVIREMHADMKSGKQMNRLVQGDVGSGKTMVALMTMLIALDNGYQACIMAPTEILAEQHLATFRKMLGDMPVRVELLTGIVKGKRRKSVLEGLQSGEVQILVGTHAVIEDNVCFRNLGLVVIDEQHRFGVAQRAKLWEKNITPPHVMVMTATPIPRTLAMTLYGDLDVSVIDELPPGRKPIQTMHMYDNNPEKLYSGINQQIQEGRQVYMVYPLVKESEKLDLKNVEAAYVHLQKVFPEYKISMVHGQMKPADKDAEMQRFASGETHILVATTVIEVGVNVPNASVMVIQNAERFGLSQLHQLRGRVGRGASQSYCILVTKYDLSRDTRRRIDIMTETNDGFEIAEADLKFRGPGDLEGTQQSGVAFDLKLANLARDGQIVQLARDTATRVLDEDPMLVQPQNHILVERLKYLKRDEMDWSNIS